MANTGWKVTRQLPDQIQNLAGGAPVDGTVIEFVTGAGNSGSVFVPDSIYHQTEKVAAMIRRQASQVDAIGNLAEGMAE